ncbi:MAG: hypothetical protein ABI994_05965, partial [Gemmatimonadales bacterium]
SDEEKHGEGDPEEGESGVGENVHFRRLYVAAISRSESRASLLRALPGEGGQLPCLVGSEIPGECAPAAPLQGAGSFEAMGGGKDFLLVDQRARNHRLARVMFRCTVGSNPTRPSEAFVPPSLTCEGGIVFLCSGQGPSKKSSASADQCGSQCEKDANTLEKSVTALG